MLTGTFRTWLLSRLLSNFSKKLVSTVVAWQIYKLTNDPLALGLIGLSEAVPFLIISLWAGHFVDGKEKKSVMVLAEAGLTICAAGLFLTTYLPKPPLLLLYFFIGLTGFCSSFENISASAYSQLLITKEHFPRATAFNLAGFQIAVIAAPILGGWMLAQWNARIAFFLAAVLFVFSLLAASMLKPIHSPPTNHADSAIKSILEGLRFIKSKPVILSAMSLDMVAVLFGDVIALFPIFADRFGAGSIGFGMLRASPAIGSGLLSALQATEPFIKASWKNLKLTVLLFGASIICFGLSPNIYWAMIFLAIGGMADGISVIIRQSIYQAHTPDPLRGRVASVSGIFISSSNEIGAFESGLAAKLMGVVPSVLFGGCMTMLSVGVMSRIFRNVDQKHQE